MGIGVAALAFTESATNRSRQRVYSALHLHGIYSHNPRLSVIINRYDLIFEE